MVVFGNTLFTIFYNAVVLYEPLNVCRQVHNYGKQKVPMRHFIGKQNVFVTWVPMGTTLERKLWEAQTISFVPASQNKMRL